LGILAELKESITNHERQLESLDFRISGLEPNLAKAQADLTELRSGSPALLLPVSPLQTRRSISPVRISTRTSAPRVSPSKSLKPAEFPFKTGWFSKTDPFHGIISYLTRKHSENVQDKGIVAITSKSVNSAAPQYALRNVADLTSGSYFWPENEPGQWICWDFHAMRVRPDHGTIKSRFSRLKSWVVESSLNGKTWTEIDRQTDNYVLKDAMMATFAVSNSAECRLIRLTQTGINHYESHSLVIEGLEFFGTLLE
jgi:hypothetical protein